MRAAILYLVRRAVVLIAIAWAACMAAHAETPPTVIVVDSSNSMSAPLNGEVRLDSARKVLGELLGHWKADAPLGLIAYGHRKTSDCNDIEVIQPIGKVDAPALTQRLTKLRAKGKTPLAASIEEAAALLEEAGQGGTIILVTDGVETCRADPCAVAEALRKANAALTIHVVGFAVETKDEEQLACIAKSGGGTYRTAADAAALAEGVTQAAAEAVAPTPPPPPPPAPEPPAPPPPPEPPKQVQIGFEARITGGERLVDHPVAWHITGDNFTYEGGGAGVALSLLPGRYHAEARASNAVATRDFEVRPDTDDTVVVTLAAGRLTARAVPYKGAEPIAQNLAWTLEPLDGQPVAETPQIAKPALLLAAGRYRLTAIWNTQRATAEITVKPGQPLDTEISFKLGQLQLTAATSAEAEPLTAWQGLSWRAVAPDGQEAAKIANDAQPVFNLPAGRFTAELAIAGATLRHEIDVTEGQAATHRFIVPAGHITLTAALGPNAEPFTDWRDASWTVTPLEAVGVEPGKPIAENQMASPLILDLMPGRWSIAVKSGTASATREIAVQPDSTETIRLDLGAARLNLSAEPATGEPPLNIVFEAAPLSSDGTPGTALSLGGTSRDLPVILPAGRYRITATDEQSRTASQDVTLTVGTDQTMMLQLR